MHCLLYPAVPTIPSADHFVWLMCLALHACTNRAIHGARMQDSLWYAVRMSQRSHACPLEFSCICHTAVRVACYGAPQACMLPCVWTNACMASNMNTLPSCAAPTGLVPFGVVVLATCKGLLWLWQPRALCGLPHTICNPDSIGWYAATLHDMLFMSSRTVLSSMPAATRLCLAGLVNVMALLCPVGV